MLGLDKRHKARGFDKREIEEKGVILPIKQLPLRFLPGRHLLKRAGDGMRFLRSRPFEPLEDNPRDIDKFSPQYALMVNEWEHESQADILVLADISASMAFPLKSRVRNNVILQLIYSLWRAGDRVRVAFFAHDVLLEIRAANLRSQMEQFQQAVNELPLFPETDIQKALETYQAQVNNGLISLIILVSDFLPSNTATTNPLLPLDVLRRLGSDLIPITISFKMGEESQGVGRVWDPERNRHGMVLLSRSRRERINSAERARVKMLGQQMRNANLDFVTIEEPRQVFPFLSNLARTREKRRL